MISRAIRRLGFGTRQGSPASVTPPLFAPWNPSRCASSAIVFHRTFEPPLVKGKAVTQEMINKSVPNDPIYERYVIMERESEEEANVPPIQIILLKSIEEYGKKGQVLTMPSEKAHKELLFHGLATYASPENVEMHKDIIIPEDAVQFSSTSVQKALPELSKTVCCLVMHDVNPWTVERWHVRLALRRMGISVASDNCVSIPETPLTGPNPELQGKEFCCRLKANDMEVIPIRCVLFQDSERLEAEELEGVQDLTLQPAQVPPSGWEHMFFEPVFEEERKELEMIPRHQMDESTVAENSELKHHLKLYKEWKANRDVELFS